MKAESRAEQRAEQRVEEGRAEFQAEALNAFQNAILDTLETRFGMTQPKIQDKIMAIQDLDQLRKLVPIAAVAESLTAFDAELG